MSILSPDFSGYSSTPFGLAPQPKRSAVKRPREVEQDNLSGVNFEDWGKIETQASGARAPITIRSDPFTSSGT